MVVVVLFRPSEITPVRSSKKGVVDLMQTYSRGQITETQQLLTGQS